ncbi:MAG: hypothetical protein NT023_25000 [Armatimonadetes bacterium]|nr:hypothetical protein [Armatimonadota bacterium]
MYSVEWTADIYFEAAKEHLATAEFLFDRGAEIQSQDGYADNRYFYAHYWAGIAIECMLRAYQKRMNSTEWDGRHDLMKLYRDAFGTIVPDIRKEEISSALTDVMRRWHSSDRYSTSEGLRRYLYARRFDTGAKGGELKKNARILVNAARSIVGLGGKKWQYL